jgi:DNA polymerase-3 subunit gamma/tau
MQDVMGSKETEKEKPVVLLNIQAQAFTKPMAIGTLIDYSNELTSQTEKMMAKSDFDLEKENLLFKLSNKILHDVFLEKRQEMADFLRKKLHNANIQLDAYIAAEETKAKPRTEQEKFESMAMKNPDIWKLKDALGLDLLF